MSLKVVTIDDVIAIAPTTSMESAAIIAGIANDRTETPILELTPVIDNRTGDIRTTDTGEPITTPTVFPANVLAHVRRTWSPFWFGKKTLFIRDPTLGYYREDAGDILKCIQTAFEVIGYPQKPKMISEIIDGVVSHTAFYPFDTKTCCINFSNGILNIKTMGFSETSEHIFDYSIATPFVRFPDGTPELDAFLSQFGDAGNEVIDIVAKSFFQRATLHPLKEFTVLYGDADSGKSTLIKFISESIGEKNCGNVMLHSLLTRFGLAGLEHKTLNLGDDLPDALVRNSGLLNELLGSTRHTIEKKGIDIYSGTVTAYHTFTCNHLPPLDDDDSVLWSKIRLVRCDSKFKRGVVVAFPDIVKQQLVYRSAVLAASWLVAPYCNPQTPDEVRSIWYESTISVERFIDERLVFDPAGVAKADAIKTVYHDWCIHKRTHPYVKALLKRLQPYSRHTSSGNVYTFQISDTIEFESDKQNILS